MPLTSSQDAAPVIRRFLLGIVVLGLAGTGIELVLLEHYLDSWQLVPLFFIGLTLAVIAAHGIRASAGTVRLLRVTMSFLIVAGAIGVALHFRGSLEFQLELDPTQSGWALVTQVLHAKAPPTLAPGVMAQLGLLGLVYTYKHPALSQRSSSVIGG
jgi:hypothetical protein